MKLLKYITLTFLLLCSFLLSYFIFNDEGRYYLNESESESMSDYYKEIFESEYEKVKQKDWLLWHSHSLFFINE